MRIDYVISWSGGKDSTLALARVQERLGPNGALLTMFTETGERSRAHGLTRAVLEGQATALNLPLHTGAASWNDYTPVFVATLRTLRDEHGITAAVFGDIDLQAHRDWCLKVCAEVGIECIHPLWGEPRDALVHECLASGIRARLIAVQQDVLPPDLLGRELDADLLTELDRHGVDLAGEQGEYHTVVFDAPLFAHPLLLRSGERSLRDNYWHLEQELETRS